MRDWAHDVQEEKQTQLWTWTRFSWTTLYRWLDKPTTSAHVGPLNVLCFDIS